MPETEAEAESEAEQRTEYAWASQTPDTRIKGTPKSIIYSGRIDDTVAQNDTSFGVVLEDVEVVDGTLWKNQSKPDGETTAEGVDEDESRPTDYRIADEDDRDTTVANGALVTDENGPNTYEEADEIEEDAVIVWYNGMSGERLSRVLDFNGRPFARWTDDGYLVKGLYQVAEGWRDASGDKRSQMKDEGKAPRVVRAPILRQRVEVEYDEDGNVDEAELLDEPNEQELLIDMSRFQGGRAYEIHALDAAEFADEFGNHSADLPRNDGGFVKDDVESELDMPYTPAADEILEQAEYAMHMYTSDGWQNEPDGWTPQSTSEVGSFGVSADGSGSADTDGLTAAQEQFVNEVVDEVKGTGLEPDEVFDGGLAGLIGKFSDQFDRVPEADEIREEVYARVSHLDPTTLEE